MNREKEQLKKHLATILNSQPEENILEYVLSIKTEVDYDEFTESILDTQNSSHINANDAIKKILFGSKEKPRDHQGKFNAKLAQAATNNASFQNAQSTSYNTKNSGRGKKKFQDIKSFKQKEKIKKGRSACSCQGQEHDFMNNCLNCGRIHCVQEGPGPCLFCGIFIDVSGRNNISTDFKPKENKIYDDDNDFFKVNHGEEKKSKKAMVVALDFATRRVIESTEEDEKLRKKLLEDCKKHLKNVEQLFRNLQKTSEFKPVANIYDEMVDLLIKMRHVKLSGEEPDLRKEDSKMPDTAFNIKVASEGFDQGLCLSMHQPYASLLVAGVKKGKIAGSAFASEVFYLLRHEKTSEKLMVSQKEKLSVHQVLIQKIFRVNFDFRHEGRNWPTNHRGTLWIAAAAHKPDLDEISIVEKFYRNYYNEPDLKFPTSYPTSCLLGCVEVEECLNQEAYRKQYPNGESESPYVLICNNPIILPIFYPIVGQHKIYALDKDLHKCVKMCMRYANLLDNK